jgi:hypothetical protein
MNYNQHVFERIQREHIYRNESVYACVHVCMYAGMPVCTHARTDGCIDVWMYGCMDGWMDGFMDVWRYVWNMIILCVPVAG